MDIATFLVFVVASFGVILVPGPTVTVIVANSLRHGSWSGWANIAGTQAGLATMVLIVAFGLEIITTSLAFLFEWVRILGAIYLVWLGLQLLRGDGTMGTSDPAARRAATGWAFFRQGFLVIWSNPKALLFLGGFLPPFVGAEGNAFMQTVLLGATFMVVGTIGDGFYAVVAGRAGGLLTRSRVRAAEIVGGTALVGGGLWLGFSKRLDAAT